MPTISADDFKTLLPCLEQIYIIKSEGEQPSAQQLLIEQLERLSLDILAAITKHADFLDIPLLLDCCIKAIIHKITKDNIITEKASRKLCKRVPIDILGPIIKQCIIQKGLIDTKPLAQYDGHTGWIHSVCAVQTGDGWRIISGSHGETIRIWDMSGRQLARYEGHTSYVNSVCAVQTRDGWRIISGSADNTIRI